MRTTLTGRNQITLPAALTRAYGLKPGARIEWRAGKDETEFIGRILPDPARVASDLRGAGRRYLKEGVQSPLETLAEERSAEEEAREAAL